MAFSKTQLGGRTGVMARRIAAPCVSAFETVRPLDRGATICSEWLATCSRARASTSVLNKVEVICEKTEAGATDPVSQTTGERMLKGRVLVSWR